MKIDASEYGINQGYSMLAYAIVRQAIKDKDAYFFKTEYGRDIVALALRYDENKKTFLEIERLLDEKEIKL